jgi:hypothetical protein
MPVHVTDNFINIISKFTTDKTVELGIKPGQLRLHRFVLLLMPCSPDFD